jgi:sugar lactone lactonase YvrE
MLMIGIRSCVSAAALALGLLAVTQAPTKAWDRGLFSTLAVLPDLLPASNLPPAPSSVEGLTVGPDGNIYVPSFGFNFNGEITTGNANLFVISPAGQVIRQVPITNSSPQMLGLAFNPVNGRLLVLDFGAGRVLQVDPVTGIGTPITAVIPGSGLNALTFDQQGNAYVSDSFNGVIWKVAPDSTATTLPPAWSNDPLLSPGTGLTPPFGANGVEFNNERSALYVANTAFHQIIKIPVNGDGSAGQASIFVTGINAPDGIMIDANDNIWICSNQEDKVTVIEPTAGKVIAKLGDFDGIDQNGIVHGLLFPASLAFSLDRSILYVSNLTLFLPFAGANAAVDSPWTLEARHYTVEQMLAVIPPIQGNN